MERSRICKDLGKGWQLCESSSRPGLKYLYNKNNGNRHWASKSSIEALLYKGAITRQSIANTELVYLLRDNEETASVASESKNSADTLDLELKPKESSWIPSSAPTKTFKDAEDLASSPSIAIKFKSNAKTPAQDRLKRLQKELKTRHNLRSRQLTSATKQEETNKEDIESIHSNEKPNESFSSPQKRLENIFATPTIAAKTNTSLLKKDKVPNENRFLLHDELSKKDKKNAKNMGEETTPKSSFVARAKTALFDTAKIICKLFSSGAGTKNGKNQTSEPCDEEFTFLKDPENFGNKSVAAESTAYESSATITSSFKLNQPLNESSFFSSSGSPSSTEGSDTVHSEIIIKPRRGLLSFEKAKLKKTFKHTTSANDRLKHLRNVLEEADNISNQLDSSIVNFRRPLPTGTTVAMCPPKNSEKPISEDVAMDMEPMEWEEIDTSSENVQSVASAETSPVPATNKRMSPTSSVNRSLSPIDDVAESVGQNILRLMAESRKSTTTWKPDSYYMILDTNVLLEEFSFTEDLVNVRIAGSDGVIIYIPYMVLQELDRLKHSCRREGIKVKAARAIKFLNSLLEAKDPVIQGQTAIDEKKYIISVDSPDDSILNCCLQVMEKVPNVLLITEDINLRNKASSNAITVSSKHDLIKPV